MAKLCEKLWNWGHLEGSHDHYTKSKNTMTPERFADEYGVKNAFIISFTGNIQPPFDGMADRFSVIRELKWSVLGDASTPLPEHELGNTPDIIDVLDRANITGGIVDDFFDPNRMERFTPEVLKKIKAELNAHGRDFWCVLYDRQLTLDLSPYVDCFDGITFWIWNPENVCRMDEYYKTLRGIIGEDKPLMLGIYLFDYEGGCQIPAEIFESQISRYFDMLKTGDIEGVIFCSSALADDSLESCRILKHYVREMGDVEICEREG